MRDDLPPGRLQPGTTFAAHRIESVVGQGGMGVVYRAREPRLDRIVALKVIAPHLLDDETARRRFVPEARSAASIDHPNVIPVHYAGDHDGIAYIAMRHVDGDDLRTLVRRDGPLPPARAVAIVTQVAAALDAIHAQGLVHRDVKPGNILLGSRDHVYVTDFGLAKSVAGRGPSTHAGRWVGTVDFVAPEQIRGRPVDARTDVYALGGVLYYALTGHAPFRRDNDEAKMWAHLSTPPPRPSETIPGLPARLDDVVARAMAKPPADRYPSAGDLARAAEAALGGRRVEEPERVVARGPAAPTEMYARSPDESTLSATQRGRPAAGPATALRRRRTAAGLVLGGVAMAAVLVIGLGGGDERQRSASRGPSPTPSPPPAAEPSPTPAGVTLGRTFENVGDRPQSVAVAGGDVWVGSFRRRRLVRIDAATGRRTTGPRVGVGSGHLVADGDVLWTANSRTDQVLRIDAVTGRVTGRIATPGPPADVAVDGRRLWVVIRARGAGTSDRILRYDGRSRPPVHLTSLQAGVRSMVAAHGALWVAPRRGMFLARIDPVTGARLDTTRLRGRPWGIAAGAGYVWAAERASDVVVRVEHSSGDPVETGVCRAPANVTVSRGRVFVACAASHEVVVLDAHTLDQRGRPIRVGLAPQAITAGAGRVWVTSVGANSLSRLDW